MSSSTPLWLSLLLALASDPGPGLWDETASTAAAFRSRVLEQRDFEAGLELVAEDVLFRDPTAVAFDPRLEAGVRGRESVFRLMQSFGLESAELDPATHFHAGPFAVSFGELTTNGGTGMNHAPFLTVLRVREGRVVARTDYGDYDAFAPPAARIDGVKAQLDHPLVLTALAYLEAIADRDAETAASLLHEDARYADPTSVALGRETGAKGRAAALDCLRSTTSPQGFEVDELQRFFHGKHAVFHGTYEASFSLGEGEDAKTVACAVPFVTVLKIEHESVVEHVDYVGYDAVHVALRAQEQESAEEGP